MAGGPDKKLFSTRRQLELMQQLQEFADARAQAEQRIAAESAAELTASEEDRDHAQSHATQEFNTTRRDLENEYAAAKLTAATEFRDRSAAERAAFEADSDRLAKQKDQVLLQVDRRSKEAEWQAMAVFDSEKDLPRQTLQDTQKRLSARRVQIDGLQRDAQALMAMRGLSEDTTASESPEVADQSAPPSNEAEPDVIEPILQESINKTHSLVLQLQAQRLPTALLEQGRLASWYIGFALLLIVPAGFALGWSPWLTPTVVLVGGAALTGSLYAALGSRARQQSKQLYVQVAESIAHSRSLEHAAGESARELSETQYRAVVEKRDHEVAEARRIRDAERAEAQERHDAGVLQLQKGFESKLEILAEEHDRAIALADEKFPPLLSELADRRSRRLEDIVNAFHERRKAAEAKRDSEWKQMAEAWTKGFGGVVTEFESQNAARAAWFPPPDRLDITEHRPPETALPALCFGRYLLPLTAVKNGVPADERLKPKISALEVPAWLSLAEHPRMVLTGGREHRPAASRMLRLLMQQLLIGTQPGKLRFTVIDAAAMGQGLASFMHLADEDEQLIGGQVWTDPREIDERLAEVVSHTQKVLQKYLRNEFENLDEYNRSAGEVAEPYHVVVVSGFPVGLTDGAIRKLERIAQSGPQCGVSLLIDVDTEAKLPTDFQLEKLTEAAVHLDCATEPPTWRYPLYERLPLEPAPLLEGAALTEFLEQAGRRSREASRVEVPFSEVAPREESYWQSDASRELVVPIGRAGARNALSLRLGRGTSQHVLIAGKTGSGKSTLLHALVTNTALHYSPREVELYLVDFKKGVEFKAYAAANLPHARVIAIESEREFGVSVLERLDKELHRRGELFRLRGVQDLAEFRRAAPEEPMPRVLLVVDEFQELFVADDKLAQDSALLLDRLVRQGRAFGVHVLLGSQTLGGAYTLARTTIGQMAVRIALECSESDAHLILSDENPAARYLSRPGEAIYNDENGLPAGNELFQVVWLPDSERREFLSKAAGLQEKLGEAVPPQIVFEGNAPTDPSAEGPLRQVLEHAGESESPEPVCWLGSSVRIGPPTQIALRRQGGNNLIIVSGEEKLALGLLSTALIASVAQQLDQPPHVTIFDGTRRESQDEGFWAQLTEALHTDCKVVGVREAGAAVAALAEEVSRRGEQPDEAHPAWYVVVHDLGQFRDLRKADDDFGFSTSGETKPDKLFRDILKEGPAVGVHVQLWCDSFNAMNRSIDRLTLREIDYRVAFQMSTSDSTGYIDSPMAAKLGENRAVLYRDDLGTHEKFRPYTRPAQEWLEWVASRLKGGRSGAKR
ncbi:MAG: FtsK/SpoIIIE domain-containing protein [Planctomycetota bacterium]